ncbi:MAG: DUF1648 domain-containing protein [Enterococcus sp.]|nr:DUF1648 domain-containing protein [Enterococcus sp.]
MNKNKYIKTMLLTSMVIVLASVAGLFLWQQLPAEIAIHFNTQNQPDGWASKPMVVFGLPLLLLVIHWLTFLGISADPKRQNIEEYLFKGLLWITPVLTGGMMTAIYRVALGYEVKSSVLAQGLLGVLFIFLGNYLHQVKQNYTVGIRIPWTLNNKENWNKTHRLAAWLFFIGGFILVGNIYFQQTWLFLVVMILTVGTPVGYSYNLHRKGF